MAKIKIKNKNSLPKGFTVRNGKVIKTYDAGGATVSRTLNPVNRDVANLEAEKGEMALTDTSGDGVFELYNIGGKRHTEGGTPLNLPEQSPQKFGPKLSASSTSSAPVRYVLVVYYKRIIHLGFQACLSSSN